MFSHVRLVGFVAISAVLASAQPAARVMGQTPARDAAASSDHASVSGLVTTQNGEPVWRATVVLANAQSRDATDATRRADVSTFTDTKGGFQFTDVPPGRYDLSASKMGFLKGRYGERKPGRPGELIDVAGGQDLRNLQIRLTRRSVIGGTVFDPDGRPAVGRDVSLMRLDHIPAGYDRLDPVQVTVADDRGQYRFFNLDPGRYVIAAGSGTPPGRTDALVRVFYPGALQPSQAAPIVLGPGDERDGVDIQLALMPVVAVRGRIVATDPSQKLFATMTPIGDVQILNDQRYRATIDAQGQFEFRGVVPGTYRLVAWAGRSADLFDQGESWSVSEIAVGGQDLSGVSIVLHPGISVRGRLAVAGQAMALHPPESVDLTPLSAALGLGEGMRLRDGLMDDGQISFGGLPPGRYHVAVSGSPDGWTARSAILDGRDVLDTMLDVTEDVTGLVITVTNTPAELTGTTVDANRKSKAAETVVVFATDETMWGPGTRRVRSVESSTLGAFTLRGLPAGEYFVAAVEDPEPDDIYDAKWLAALRARAVRITLAEGQTTTQEVIVR